MKFSILKLFLFLTIIIFCIEIISNTQTRTQTATTLQTATSSGIGLNSNFKMTFGSLLSKSHHKKSQNKLYSQLEESNQNTELEKLAFSNSNESDGNQIFYKGWIKYFKYSNNIKSEKPREFFRNEFYQKINKKNKDKKGSVKLNSYCFFKFKFKIKLKIILSA